MSKRPGQAPPSAEDIRAQDQKRLIEDVAAGAETSEEDLAAARALLHERTAEEIAAAYVRLVRTRMPAPEDLAENEPEPRPSAGPREKAEPRAGFEGAVWYRIDLGRNRNAEARWLLPMICRRGHVAKGDIGAIRVFDRETRFEIAAPAVERFEAAIGKSEDAGGRIERLADDAPRAAAAPRQAAASRGRSKAGAPACSETRARPVQQRGRAGLDPGQAQGQAARGQAAVVSAARRRGAGGAAGSPAQAVQAQALGLEEAQGERLTAASRRALVRTRSERRRFSLCIPSPTP